MKVRTTAVIATMVIWLYAPGESNSGQAKAEDTAPNINTNQPVPGVTPETTQPQVGATNTPQPTQTPAAQPNPPVAEAEDDNWLVNAIGFLSDVGNFVEDELFGVVGQFLGAIGLPDLIELGASIIKTPTSSNQTTKASEVLENNTGTSGGLGSYGIRDDRVMQAQRTAAIQTAESTSLSKKAQQRSAKALAQTEQDTNDSMTLGIASQNTDVTQNIMRNISLQTSLNARVNQRILQLNQQTKDNAAIANIMQTQTAKELAGKNTAERRKDVSTRNQASQQAGMMMMPGGFSLDNSNSNSNDTWFSSPSESPTNPN